MEDGLHPNYAEDFARWFEASPAKKTCLSCGSASVGYSTKRTAFFDLDEFDRIADDEELGLATATICGIRVCRDCGYVHFYSMGVLASKEAEADGL